MFKFCGSAHTQCPDCGSFHDVLEGAFIQTENSEESRYVCLECFEKYLEEDDEF